MRLVIVFIMFVLVSPLLAEGKHDNSEFEVFNNYQNEQSPENFKKAVNHYSKVDSNYSDKLMLSYLCYLELENQLDHLEANLDSLNARNKFSLANLLLEMGEYKKCNQIYEILNKDFPAWSCPFRHKGEALLKQEKLAEAEKATLKAIETREDHFDAYVQLANIQKKMGNYKKALASLNKGLSYYSSDPEEEISDEEVKELKSELEELVK